MGKEEWNGFGIPRELLQISFLCFGHIFWCFGGSAHKSLSWGSKALGSTPDGKMHAWRKAPSLGVPGQVEEGAWYPQGCRLPLEAPRPGPGNPKAKTAAAAQQQQAGPPRLHPGTEVLRTRPAFSFGSSAPPTAGVRCTPSSRKRLGSLRFCLALVRILADLVLLLSVRGLPLVY